MTDTDQTNRPFKKLGLIGLGLILTASLVAGIIWATYARPPLPEALAALESDGLIDVNFEPWLIFDPAGDERTGLIYYPGGRIDPRGYSPLLRTIAGEGYLVVVPFMPINMAIFNPSAADEIISHFPEIKNWAIGGHSVGGTSAAIYAHKNPNKIDGLVIWASFPADSSDLSNSKIPVYMIYGELDEGIDRAAIASKKAILPSNTVYLEIPGGDHHQFGSYLVEEGVDRSTISREEQHDLIVEATLELLQEIGSN